MSLATLHGIQISFSELLSPHYRADHKKYALHCKNVTDACQCVLTCSEIIPLKRIEKCFTTTIFTEQNSTQRLGSESRTKKLAAIIQ